MSDVHHATLGSGRRVTLPAELCRAFHMDDGAPILLQRGEEGILILSLDQRAERMRDELAAQVGRFDAAADLRKLRTQDAAREAGLSR